MAEAPILWRIALLGDLRAACGDRTVAHFQTRKTGALLALLALSAGRKLTREELIDRLWPDADLDSGRNRLTQAITWLRHRFEPQGTPRGSVIFADRRFVALNRDAAVCDVVRFDDAVLASKHGAPDEKIAALKAAVALYGGDLLPGYYDDWILTERQRLAASYAESLRQLASLLAESGESDEALRLARLAIAADPVQEESHVLLIRLLAADGQTAAALRHFLDLKALLEKELGIEPSPETAGLIERLKKGEASPTSRTDASISRTPGRLQASIPRPLLPVSLTRFFGRETEIALALRLLETDGARLVTLTGLGGSGKTRLSLEVAARISESLGGAVAFVPLADLRDPALIPEAIAGALRLERTSRTPMLDRIAGALSSRPSLLVLDNFEQIAAEGASVVRDLLGRIPSLSALVTSRQRLGIEGEHEIVVPPLSIPTREAPRDEMLLSPSVQLFLDRVRLLRPGFEMTDRNAGTIGRLCEKLEGVPLAIELCAAWAQTLTPAQMLERLSHRFDLLVNRRADAIPRHRTLRAALEYSYAQLSPEARRFFAGLSVFRDGWTLEAAEAVRDAAEGCGGTVLNLLEELRERSLIVALETGDAMRYRMLESLREFAGEQMASAEHARAAAAHAAYFAGLAGKMETAMRGSEQRLALLTLDRERDNLRAALEWSYEARDWETGLRLAGSLARYWHNRGLLQEGDTWLTRLLDAAGRDDSDVNVRVLAQAWNGLGIAKWSRSEFGAAAEAHRHALDIVRAAGDRRGVSESLFYLGITAFRRREIAEARRNLDESLEIATEIGDQAGIARALLNLGNLTQHEGHSEAAKAFFHRSLQIEQSLGNWQRMSYAYNNLGAVALTERDLDSAKRYFERALEIDREMGSNFEAATVLSGLGSVARMQGRKEDARRLLTDGLALARTAGNKRLAAIILADFGLLALDNGQPLRCVYLISAAWKFMSEMGASFAPHEPPEHEAALASARSRAGQLRYERARGDGEAATVPQCIAEASADPAGPDYLASRESEGPFPAEAAGVALCPQCGSPAVRFGRTRSGKQRFLCRACNRVATDPTASEERKSRILDGYFRQGLSRSALARLHGVSRNTLAKWIAEAGA